MTAPTTAGGGGETVTHGYLCIGCLLGCRLEIDEGADGDIVEVRGFSCRKGREYAVQEHTDPDASSPPRWPSRARVCLPVRARSTPCPRTSWWDVSVARRRAPAPRSPLATWCSPSRRAAPASTSSPPGPWLSTPG